MDQIASSPPSSFRQLRKPPKTSNSNNDTLVEKLRLKQTLPFLIMAILLKEGLSRCTIIQVFEYNFAMSAVFVFFLLPYISIYKKEFILDIEDKENALSAAQWLTLYLFIEIVLFKALPLMSKLTIIAFIMMEFTFKVVGNTMNMNSRSALSQNIRPYTSIRRYSLRNENQMKITILHGFIVLLILSLDFYLLKVHLLDAYTIIKYFLVLALQIFNTIFIYQFKIKSLFDDYIVNDGELLKVKWLSFLFSAFLSPMLVFFLNNTENYSILRFQKNIWIILSLMGAFIIYFLNTILFLSSKVDPNAAALKRREPFYLIIVATVISSIFMKSQDAWIISQN